MRKVSGCCTQAYRLLLLLSENIFSDRSWLIWWSSCEFAVSRINRIRHRNGLRRAKIVTKSLENLRISVRKKRFGILACLLQNPRFYQRVVAVNNSTGGDGLARAVTEKVPRVSWNESHFCRRGLCYSIKEGRDLKGFWLKYIGHCRLHLWSQDNEGQQWLFDLILSEIL